MNPKYAQIELIIDFTAETEVNVADPVTFLKREIFNGYGLNLETQNVIMKRNNQFHLNGFFPYNYPIQQLVEELLFRVKSHSYVRAIPEHIVEVYPVCRVMGSDKSLGERRGCYIDFRQPIEVY